MAGENIVAPEFLELANRYGVNVQGVVEAIYQPTYDTLAYAAAGQNALRFFQTPVGQAGRTLEDTNMRQAGSFPAPQQFLANQICLEFVPGVLPGVSSAVPADMIEYVNDVFTFATNGVLELNVGSKNKLTDAPLGKFPASHTLDIGAALSNAAAGATGLTVNYAAPKGMLYDITPINIPWGQNFDVTLSWPTALAPLPSTVAGTVRVTLNGFLYRLAQ